MAVTILLFILGLIVLVAGAELLVRGSSRLAAAFGVSPLVIGLTIVALGTASPEIAVSLQAATSGQGDITIGNVIGSNIFNILVVLGISAVIAPILIAEQLIRLDVPIMIGISVLAYFLMLDGSLGFTDGAILFVGVVAYVIFSLRQSGKESDEVKQEYAQEFAKKEPSTLPNILRYMVFVVAGLGLLVLGARWLVDSASSIAEALGVSQLIIGLTIVAIGTSLPEVATSLVAALKGESDIAVGNAVGSNIFNLLGVLGVAGLVAPDGIHITGQVLRFDFLVMLFVALISLPIFYIDSKISRFEGGVLFSYYVVYTIYLILDSMKSTVLPAYTMFLYVYVALTLGVILISAIRFLLVRKRPT
ncbi:MAG: calcium/sodium antiporter, partial [Legionella sp.]|nr:calcium/sodium antiporter [Legionella sp.]